MRENEETRAFGDGFDGHWRIEGRFGLTTRSGGDFDFLVVVSSPPPPGVRVARLSVLAVLVVVDFVLFVALSAWQVQRGRGRAIIAGANILSNSISFIDIDVIDVIDNDVIDAFVVEHQTTRLGNQLSNYISTSNQ